MMHEFGPVPPPFVSALDPDYYKTTATTQAASARDIQYVQSHPQPIQTEFHTPRSYEGVLPRSNQTSQMQNGSLKSQPPPTPVSMARQTYLDHHGVTSLDSVERYLTSRQQPIIQQAPVHIDRPTTLRQENMSKQLNKPLPPLPSRAVAFSDPTSQFFNDPLYFTGLKAGHADQTHAPPIYAVKNHIHEEELRNRFDHKQRDQADHQIHQKQSNFDLHQQQVAKELISSSKLMMYTLIDTVAFFVFSSFFGGLVFLNHIVMLASMAMTVLTLVPSLTDIVAPAS